MGCSFEKRISAYLDGDLPTERIDEVQRHLEQCGICQDLYTLVDDPQLRRRFMQAICTAATEPHMPVRVVFTLREMFLSRLA